MDTCVEIDTMERAKSLRMVLLGIWLVVTGLLLMVNAVMAAMARTDEES